MWRLKAWGTTRSSCGQGVGRKQEENNGPWRRGHEKAVLAKDGPSEDMGVGGEAAQGGKPRLVREGTAMASDYSLQTMSGKGWKGGRRWVG